MCTSPSGTGTRHLEYNRAIEAHPSSVVAFYNKSLAHAENFQFRERDLARATAEDLDRRAVASHERRTGDYRTVVQMRLEPDVIFAKFYGLEEGSHSQPVFPSWTGALAVGQGKRLAWGAVLLGLLILVLQWVAPRPYTRRCWKCGTSSVVGARLNSAAAVSYLVLPPVLREGRCLGGRAPEIVPEENHRKALVVRFFHRGAVWAIGENR
jgi:hypothetical protein